MLKLQKIGTFDSERSNDFQKIPSLNCLLHVVFVDSTVWTPNSLPNSLALSLSLSLSCVCLSCPSLHLSLPVSLSNLCIRVSCLSLLLSLSCVYAFLALLYSSLRCMMHGAWIGAWIVAWIGVADGCAAGFTGCHCHGYYRHGHGYYCHGHWCCHGYWCCRGYYYCCERVGQSFANYKSKRRNIWI